MPESSSQLQAATSAADPNTALLIRSGELMSVNRAVCHANGIPPGRGEPHRLRSFISQSVINLLTKFDITQRDGRPYVASCPKGFLQDPDVWLRRKGYCLSGWPDGLNKGAISDWPVKHLYAVAAMFINRTVTLAPLVSGGSMADRFFNQFEKETVEKISKKRGRERRLEVESEDEKEEEEVDEESVESGRRHTKQKQTEATESSVSPRPKKIRQSAASHQSGAYTDDHTEGSSRNGVAAESSTSKERDIVSDDEVEGVLDKSESVEESESSSEESSESSSDAESLSSSSSRTAPRASSSSSKPQTPKQPAKYILRPVSEHNPFKARNQTATSSPTRSSSVTSNNNSMVVFQTAGSAGNDNSSASTSETTLLNAEAGDTMRSPRRSKTGNITYASRKKPASSSSSSKSALVPVMGSVARSAEPVAGGRLESENADDDSTEHFPLPEGFDMNSSLHTVTDSIDIVEKFRLPKPVVNKRKPSEDQSRMVKEKERMRNGMEGSSEEGDGSSNGDGSGGRKRKRKLVMDCVLITSPRRGTLQLK